MSFDIFCIWNCCSRVSNMQWSTWVWSKSQNNVFMSSRKFLKSYFKSHKNQVFVANRDSQALAALNAATGHGIKIPDDMELICMNESKYTSSVRPEISSYVVPTYDLGAISMRLMTKMLKVPELQNPLTGLNFQGTGVLAAPLGAQLHRTSAVEEDMIIGIDSRYALELVRAGEVLVEYDKLIDRQLERAAITAICGFGKICDGAAKVLTV